MPEEQIKKDKKIVGFNWILILIFLAVAFLLFQSIYILVNSDRLINYLSQSSQYQELLNRFEVQEEMIISSLKAMAFFWLALACWLGLGILSLTGKKDRKTFWHFLLPSILAFVTGRWDAGICGIIASIIYKRKVNKVIS